MQQYHDLLIDALLDEGFTIEEAYRLIELREAYEERLTYEEMHQRRFIRWLAKHEQLGDLLQGTLRQRLVPSFNCEVQ